MIMEARSGKGGKGVGGEVVEEAEAEALGEID